MHNIYLNKKSLKMDHMCPNLFPFQHHLALTSLSLFANQFCSGIKCMQMSIHVISTISFANVELLETVKIMDENEQIGGEN